MCCHYNFYLERRTRRLESFMYARKKKTNKLLHQKEEERKTIK